ncbi:MAG TPA: type II secretion system F family protein [Caulobacteraceae bacterium]|jgi:tight adherence protein C|nr:type II secretion system F family protein [Caulobacteraceae bacterium]
MQTLASQDVLTLAALLMVAAGVGALGFVGFLNARTGLQRRARLEPATSGLGAPARPAAFAGLVGGVRRLGGNAESQDPSQVSALRNKLMQAGFTSREAVAYYLGARSIALIVATAATLLVIPLAFSHKGIGALAVAGVFALAAVLGPDQVLRMRRTAREREYRDGFPDLLDLLVASVQAGLSLDAAVARIGEELGNRYPNLSDHLLLMTLELRAGRSRKDAWSRLADRLGIDEARSFATMLRQAEDMGTSLGETLSAFSEDMRAKRILRAEELASALPAKLMLPLILFIFPCLMGVLILPAAIHISQAFHK